MGDKGDNYRHGYELGLKAGYLKAKEEENYWRLRYDEALKWLRAHNFGWVADHMREAVEEKIEVKEIENAAGTDHDEEEPATEKRKDGVRDMEIDEAAIFGLMGW